MRFGILALSLDDVETIAGVGYDYAELNVSAVMDLDEAGFKTAKKLLAGTGLSFDIFDEPLPPDVQICVRGFNTFIWREHLKKVCYRVSELGGKSFVFRNGVGRSIPVEGDLMGAREKVMAFIITLCEIAREYDITVMLEPLEEPLSNIYNNLDECAGLVSLLGLPNLVSMCSLRNFAEGGFGFEDMIRHKDIIRHVHIDCPTSPYPQRFCPREDDGYSYGPFFDMLGNIRYDGTISVTADTYQDYEGEITHALAFLKKLSNRD